MLFFKDPYLITGINVLLFFLFITGVLVFKLLFPKKKINILILLLIISILPTLSLFRPGIFEAGDMRPHIAQLLDFYYNLREGVFIPRWSGNLCAGFGCPIYIIEYTLPYYIGSFFLFLGLSAVSSVKLVLASSFIASGITMYLWAKDEFGKIPGFAGALLYLFAPYHLINMHYRGSVGEIVAFVFVPLLFFFTKKVIESKKLIYILLLSLTILALILSHSSTFAVAFPLSIGYGIILWYFKNKRKIEDLLIYAFSIVFGFLISTFYLIPAITQVNYTWWGQLKGISFRPILDYIVSLNYFGFLYQGSDGNYTPIIGYFHFILIIISIYLLIRNKISEKQKPILIYLLVSVMFLFFMMLSISKPVWDKLPIFSSFLFAHRLLVPIAFLTAGIGAIVISKIKSRILISLVCFLIISITILNWANRKMIPPLNNPFITSDAVYTEYFEDSNPKYIKRLSERIANQQALFANLRTSDIDFIYGKGTINSIERKQEKRSYVITTLEDSSLKENTYYFPGWRVYVNNNKVPINHEFVGEENFGKITFPLDKGSHKVVVIYENTPVEKVSKAISLASIIIFVQILLAEYLHKKTH